jgi:hypothetical protein
MVLGHSDYIWKIHFENKNLQVVAATWNSSTGERKTKHSCIPARYRGRKKPERVGTFAISVKIPA